jgi:hypothetical protein
MVPAEGIEPPTFGLQNRCSTAELSRQDDWDRQGKSGVNATELEAANTRLALKEPPSAAPFSHCRRWMERWPDKCFQLVFDAISRSRARNAGNSGSRVFVGYAAWARG